MGSAGVGHAAWGRDVTLIFLVMGRERGAYEDPKGSVLSQGGRGGVFQPGKGQAVPGAREVKNRQELVL